MKHFRFENTLVSATSRPARRALLSTLLAASLLLGSVSFSQANDETVRVMARNLYQGANLDGLVAAPTFPALLAAAGQAVLDIRASKPAERAAAVAREIVRNRVDLVGLQEAVILRTGSLNLPPDPAAAFPETTVESDGLQLLLKELQKLGEPFRWSQLFRALMRSSRPLLAPTLVSPCGLRSSRGRVRI